MSFFGDLLKFLGTAALFVATGPFGLTVGAGLATALRIGGTALYYLSNLVDKARTSVERQILSFRTSLQPGTPLPVVYGRAKVGSVIADYFLEPYGNEQVLYQIVAFAHGSWDGDGIDAIESLWLNNNLAVTLADPIAITSSSVAGTTVITTAANHGLTTGDYITIEQHTGSVSSPRSVNGNHVVTVTGLDTFTLPIAVTTGGTGGFVIFDAREHPYATNVLDFQPFVGTDAQNVGTTVLWGLRVSGEASILLPLPPKSPSQVLDSEWTSDHAGAGIVAASFRLWNLVVPEQPGSSERHPAFPSGPPAVAAILSGVRVYDTRTDAFVPGSNNPAMCIRDYLVSPTYGCGFDDTLIDDTSFEVAADYCDEEIEYDVGGSPVTQARFTCNGVVDTGQSTATNLQELLSSCRGALVWEQGKFKLRIRSEQVASPTLALTPANILGQWSFRTPGLEEQYNLVTATFINPADGEFKAEQVQWPLVGANTYLTADNEFLNRLDLSLPFTNDGLTATAVAATVLFESRSGLTCSVLCTEAALQASVGDRITVTHPTPGWTAKEFWVTAMDLRPDATVALSLLEYDATAYTLDEVLNWEPHVPRTPKPSDEVGYTPKRRVKGAFPSYLDDHLFVSWESSGSSARIATSTSAFPAAETGAIVGGTGANYDLGVVSADVYSYVTITPYAGAGATGLPGEPHYLRTLLPSASDPGAPTLTSASITDTFGGDFCTESESWTNEVSWTVTSPNDGYYHINIEYADNSAGNNWADLVSGLTTFSSSYMDDSGIAGNTGGATGATTYYRKYRISLIRKSDSATIDGPDSTSQTSLTIYTDACA